MSLSTLRAAILVEGLPYLVLTVSSARQFFREHGSSRLHTALVFASIICALLLVGGSVQLRGVAAQETLASYLLRLGLISALLSAYTFILLAADFTSTSYRLEWALSGIFLLSAGFTLVAPADVTFSSILGVPLPLVSFVVLDVLLVSFLLAAARFWRKCALTAGAMRRRLQCLGASATLLLCCVLLALGRFFVPASALIVTSIIAFLLLIAAVLLYFGSAPPFWLRRLWLLSGLEGVSQLVNTLLLVPLPSDMPPDTEQRRHVLSQMLQQTMNGLGARVGMIELWNEQAGALEVVVSLFPAIEGVVAETKPICSEAMSDVFNTRRALLRPLTGSDKPSLRWQPGTDTLLVVPLLGSGQALGVMGLCCEHMPGLKQRDLVMLQLFADQMSRWLLYWSRQQKATALEAVQHEQALKDEFIALIAHDLRTPLTVLRGRMQLLQRQLLKEGQTAAAEAVTRLDAPYTRLSQLITTLVDVSYLDTGRLQLVLHAVDLVGVVRKVVAGASQGRTIALEVIGPATPQAGEASASAAPLVVMADPGRLEQVLSNLLDNARKYSPVESSITVRVERPAGTAEALVSVRDAGIGIPPADQARLFQRWFRATNSSTQHYSGIGLGLYISHEVITLHGGQLWVESSGIPGEGSTFFFTLPLIRPEQLNTAGMLLS